MFVDLGAQFRVQTDIGIQPRAPVYPLLAKLGLHEAPAHVAHGLDGYQKVAFVEAQEPSLRGVQEAHLPVDLVDEQVPDEAYVLLARVEELAVDKVVRHEEDVRPLPCIIHEEPPFRPVLASERPMVVPTTCCHL